MAYPVLPVGTVVKYIGHCLPDGSIVFPYWQQFASMQCRIIGVHDLYHEAWLGHPPNTLRIYTVAFQGAEGTEHFRSVLDCEIEPLD